MLDECLVNTIIPSLRQSLITNISSRCILQCIDFYVQHHFDKGGLNFYRSIEVLFDKSVMFAFNPCTSNKNPILYNKQPSDLDSHQGSSSRIVRPIVYPATAAYDELRTVLKQDLNSQHNSWGDLYDHLMRP